MLFHTCTLLEAHLKNFNGTLMCRGTPVVNHWSTETMKIRERSFYKNWWSSYGDLGKIRLHQAVKNIILYSAQN